jgi:transcriptional regulator with XRE-family HTH domain
MLKTLIQKRWSYNHDMAGRPPTNPAPTFGARLAALRKARGWTQPQLASELNISLAALTHYERKAQNPSAEFVSRVAKLFNVSVDNLLGVSVKPVRKSGPPSQLEERLVAVRRLPRQKQKVVLQLLDSFLQTSGAPNGR